MISPKSNLALNSQGIRLKSQQYAIFVISLLLKLYLEFSVIIESFWFVAGFENDV